MTLHYCPILGLTHYSIEPVMGSKRVENRVTRPGAAYKKVTPFHRLFRTQFKITTKQQRYDDNQKIPRI
jgi:hypothetical protein